MQEIMTIFSVLIWAVVLKAESDHFYCNFQYLNLGYIPIIIVNIFIWLILYLFFFYYVGNFTNTGSRIITYAQSTHLCKITGFLIKVWHTNSFYYCLRMVTWNWKPNGSQPHRSCLYQGIYSLDLDLLFG